MIDYIKYTINGQTYSLTNNGDGTWSRELDAPNVSGMYSLTLEIGQGGTKTHIDSTDPRYAFYLEVIEEIEREVNLASYLPDYLRGVLEFNVLFESQNVEFDVIYNRINKTMLDYFIRTASVERITELENFLRIKGEGTLNQRRSYLLALMQKGRKLNEGMIKEVTKTITGSDCIVTFFGADELNNPDPESALLQVQVLSPDNTKDYRYQDIFRTLKPLVPSHVKLLVIKYFSTWGDVANNFQDWNSVYGMSSWESLRSYIPPQ